MKGDNWVLCDCFVAVEELYRVQGCAGSWAILGEGRGRGSDIVYRACEG